MSRATSWRSSWRLALRLARREALRSRGRSLLVLVMIALPVLAVTAADVVIATAQVSSVEGLDRRLGNAQALVTVEPGVRTVYQRPDPEPVTYTDGRRRGPGLGTSEVSDVLGGARLLQVRAGEVAINTDRGVGNAEATEIDLADPLSTGLFHGTAGRLPRASDEVVVNKALLDKGYAIGDRLRLDDAGSGPTIVGIAESTTARSVPVAVGPVGSLGLGLDSRSWLAGGGPVSWEQVRLLNDQGAHVLSRAVITDPPPASQVPEQVREVSPGLDQATLTVLVLVVVMALIEVVLLAGPAFAVGARRQQRSLALMAAAGGTPIQARRVVLAGAVVLGAAAAVIGIVLGIGVGWAALPLVQRFSDTFLGPLDVRWLQLGGVAVFGLLAALLACLVPARIASRQDVVAVLAGRRGDRRTSRRSPVLGLVLLGLGIAGAAYGARSPTNGEIAIAGSAILAVLAMILLVPVVLVTLAALSGRLPLVLRYAVRDASRHRSRTVPAVAAVAATVAGVVALGIAVSSDEAQNRETYVPSVMAGVGTVSGAVQDWSRVAGAVREQIPGAEVAETRGIVENQPDGGFTNTLVRAPGLRVQGGQAFGSTVLVSDGELPPGLLGLSEQARVRTEEALRAGRVVAFSDTAHIADRVTVRWAAHSGDTFERTGGGSGHFTARVVRLTTSYDGPVAVLPSAVAEQLGAPTGVVGLIISGTSVTEEQETNATEAVAAITQSAHLTVERGYQAPSSTVIVQLVLAALGAVLMLGGTLTATFLALSDARPDLATLAAVGAGPGRRRGVAAAYALVVGLVGALLGAAVGFVPGVAITYPLTSSGYQHGTPGMAHYLDVPWLLVLGLVLALPLLTAALVWLTARSRLPMVARLD